MLILPMYTDNERHDMKEELRVKIAKLNLIEDKQSKEYKELDEETTAMYEMIHGL